MKITNLTTETLLFNDLGKQVKGVSPVERFIRLGANDSMYLLETSDVLLSAQSGDIKRFADAGKLSVNDRALAVANSGTVVIIHNFGLIPNVTVVIDPTGTPTAAIIGTDVTVTHSTNYNVTTVTNISGGALNLDIRIG